MKLWKKITIAALAGLLALTPAASSISGYCIEAQAAEKYTYETVKNNKTFKGKTCTIKVKNYYKRVVLTGSSAAVKSINEQLKKYSDVFLAMESDAFDYAESACGFYTYDDTFSDYVTQKVSYLSDSIISIKTTSVWYAGGVNNIAVYGYTFNLRTGALINKLTSVTKTSSLDRVKSTLKAAIEADQYHADALENMKASDFNFYINSGGKVVVCFGPYELGGGGWTKMFKLAGKYEK